MTRPFNISYFFLTALSIGALVGCITDYEHPGIDHLSGLLVVEGTISNDSTFIILSTTAAMNENLSDANYIDDAYVTVENDKGGEFYGGWKGSGVYYVITGDLDTDTRYRLRIEHDGHTYLSEFIEPIITPEIDALDLFKEAPGENVHLRVSTHNSDDASRYYRWSYEEIWEYTATYAATHYQEPYLNGIFDVEREYFAYDPPHSPYYYCWGYNNSNNFLLASTVKLTSNTVNQFSLLDFVPFSNRLTIIYYVKVKQNALHKEAYDYFSNLKENAENTGSIFGPIPSEMPGNITCVTDGGIPVIGYVDVSTTIEIEKMFSYDDGDFINLYESSIVDCPSADGPSTAAAQDAEWASMTLFSIMGDGRFYNYSYPSCIDCRRAGAYYDRKPPFWPNDHF